MKRSQTSQFTGITSEYRKTDEYKTWFKAIKEDHPNMPDYLIEFAINSHKINPQFYKTAAKELKNMDKIERKPIEDYDAIKVFDSVDDIPSNKNPDFFNVEIISTEIKEE
jgi:hypothetical protein